MDDRFPTTYPRIEPSLGATLGRAIDLAQRVAADELRLLQLESQERVGGVLRRGAWIALGTLCLLVAWIGGWAAAFVALGERFSLEERLALLALAQLVVGAALLWAGLRSRDAR